MDIVSCLKLLTQSGDFKGGFLVFGFFWPPFNIVGLFLVFVLGLKLLQSTWHGKRLVQFLCDVRGKLSGSINGFCSEGNFDQLCDSKIMSCKCGSLELLENPKLRNVDDLLLSNELLNLNGDTSDDDYERDCCVEDEEFDVMALRRLVKIERQRANMAYAELEKERMAASSAADEAMAMILRLQREKSLIEIEANQYRKLAEQKQEYDQEVIQSLQWIIMKHESKTSILEEKLRLCQQKLKQFLKSDEMDHFEEFDASLDSNSTAEDGLEDKPNNLVGMASSVL